MRVIVRDQSRKTNHLSGLSVPPELVSQSLSWTLESPKTNTLADGLIQRTSSILDETVSKTVHKDEENDR